MMHTPLYDRHVALGAKMVEFAGYAMPVRYGSDKAEHLAVRNAVGVFDVSHMGEVFLEGEEALACVQKLISNDASTLEPGQSIYSGMLNERGGFIDDCIVYRFSEAKFLICVNASNRHKDFAHIAEVAKGFDVVATDESEDWVQLAVQGPKAPALVAKLTSDEILDVAAFSFRLCDVQTTAGNASAIVARTGYTGEDGFEIYVKSDAGTALWDQLFLTDSALVPCGLGARDTLRLEAAMRLYGNDIDDAATPLEAGLSWTVKYNHDFIGKEALLAQKAAGVPRRFRGIKLLERGIPRSGYAILNGAGEKIGTVTSGSFGPTLNGPVAMGYVRTSDAKFGSVVAVEIRGKAVPAELVKLPFYRRGE